MTPTAPKERTPMPMPMTMTAIALAAALNGREYRREMTDDEAKEAKAAGLLVIFGASDDLIEFRGAVDDHPRIYEEEIGAYGGAKFKVDQHGLRPKWSDVDKSDQNECAAYLKRKDLPAVSFKAKWDHKGYSWWIEPEAEFAANVQVFDILEDGEKYCRGIVFALPGVAS